MDPRHWNTLELPKVLERLASFTSFSAGADKARHLAPSTLLPEIREWLETTSEARALLVAHPRTSVGGAHDVRPQAQAARRGVTLPPGDLLDIQGTLQTSRALQQTLTRLERQFPRLADIAGRIAPCPELIDAIGRCLDERGEVRDNASDALARVRRELRVAHDRLQERLQRIISSPKNAGYLQESIITLREGRYVIPLKADFKGRIRGIVHDRSASGATLFIEPIGVVEMNNSWRELQIEEEQQVQRVLADLSGRVAYYAAHIEHTVEALADLDLALAKAHYADETDANAPQVHSERTVRLAQARHPLLDPQTVVPIDVLLDDETQLLVITGPNTGGKTVTLKTVGLLTLMAQAGLHLPVNPGSAISPFAAVYADIGDEQSIEQSLSTFSSHLTNILSFIDQADDRSLVLLDELGAGTDPAEGSALARAILESFRQRGSVTLVATHYPELKAYAQLTPNVKNASVEFDPETLRPTYRLTIGLPGRSNAFAIARRLGLSEETVRQAEALVSQEDRQTESLLNDLHRLRLQAVEARDAAEKVRAEAQRAANDARKRLASVENERLAILEAARQESTAELALLRDELNRLRQQIQAAESFEVLATVEQEIDTLEQAASAPVELLPEIDQELLPPLPRRPVRAGDTVWVKPLSAQGEVLSVDGQTAEVQVGPAHVRLALAQLELRRAAAQEELQPARVVYETPRPDIRLDLRGLVVEEALEQLDRHLDAAALAGLPWVQIVHGKGTGALRQAIRDLLRNHPLVTLYRHGDEGEGGEGVTVAYIVQG